MVRQRVCIRFRKQGDLRLIGHRDLVRSMERLFRRAGLRLGMSQGFHPKPRMSFPSALAVGIEGIDEVLELELTECLAAEDVLARLRINGLPGLVFQSVQSLPPGSKKAQIRSATYRITIPAARCGEAHRRIARLLAAPSWPIRRPSKNTQIDLRPFLEELTLKDGVLRIRLAASRQASASARDVLEALDLADIEREGSYLTRTEVELLS